MTTPISESQPIESYHLKAMGGAPNACSYLSLSNAYATLVAAPASGVTLITQLLLRNNDSVNADFYFKVVRSGVDYLVFRIELAPYERLIVEFPFILDTNTSIEAKTSASISAKCVATTLKFEGGMSVANFSGTAWTDLLTVPAGKAYSILGLMLSNSYNSAQNVSFQIIDNASNVKWTDSILLNQEGTWPCGEKFVMGAGWKIQVKHGAASYTGSAVAAFIEVPS